MADSRERGSKKSIELAGAGVSDKRMMAQTMTPKYGSVSKPDQVRVSDITYIRLADSSFVYLAIVLDVFTRVIKGWALGKDITHELTLTALNKALKKAVPQIHHSDQGFRPSTAWDIFNLHVYRYPVQSQYQNQHVRLRDCFSNGWQERKSVIPNAEGGGICA